MRTSAWRLLPWSARFLIVNQFGVWLGFFLVVPLLATHGTVELGISSAAVGLVLGLRTLSQQGPMFFAGLAADRAGLRTALLTGCVLRVVSLVLLALADGLWQLLGAITVFGLAGSLIAPATRAYLGLTAGERRTEAFALFNSASVLGSALGPLVAVAASPLGFDVTCYLAAAVFGAMAIGQVLALPPAPETQSPPLGPAVRAILRARPLVWFALASSGLYAVWNQAFLLLPLEATRLVGHPAAASGGIFLLIAVTTFAIQGRAVDANRRWGAVRTTAFGSLLTGFGYVAVLVTRTVWPGEPGTVAAWAGGVLLGLGTITTAVGNGLATPSENDLVVRLSPPGQSGAGFGLSGCFGGLAATAVTPLVGKADDLGWEHGVPWLAPVLVCFVAVVTTVAVRLCRSAV